MKIFILSLIASLTSSLGIAMTPQYLRFLPPPKLKDLNAVISMLDRRGQNNEVEEINSILDIYLKKVKPGEKFRADKFRKEPNAIEEGSERQSWKDEAALALDGKVIPRVIYLQGKEDLYSHFFINSPIGYAKRVAKERLFKAIKENWERLSQTDLFSEQDIHCPSVSNCPRLDDAIARLYSNSFFFDYQTTTSKNDGYFYFNIPYVGKVEVSKRDYTAGVILNIDSYNYNNKADPRPFRTDEDAGVAPPPQPADTGADQNTPANGE